MNGDRADQILDFAEREMRRGGFDAVSFRDIAAAIGIKSASVHYHFPTKADLSKAVVTRYAERFIDGLGAPDDPADSPADRLKRLGDAYLTAYRVETTACLCAVFGSVALHLPAETSSEVRVFYDRLRLWVATALEGYHGNLTPNLVISLLQGGMVLTLAAEDENPLLEAVEFLATTGA